jgi:hypothetical protein
LLGFLKKRYNIQQCFEVAFGWLGSESLDVARSRFSAAEDGQLVNAF